MAEKKRKAYDYDMEYPPAKFKPHEIFKHINPTENALTCKPARSPVNVLSTTKP
jgi:hypothetical protein